MIVGQQTQCKINMSIQFLMMVSSNCFILGLIVIVMLISNIVDIISISLYSLIVLSILIICMIKHDKSYFWVFALAMLIRLMLVVILQAFPPVSPQPYAEWYVPLGAIYPDESFYLLRSRELASSWESLFGIISLNPYDRVAGYYSLINLLIGKEFVWYRLINTLLGSLTALVVYNTIIMNLGVRIKKWAGILVVCCPVIILWSGIFLKECLLGLGIALFLNGISRVYINLGYLRGLIVITIGLMVVLFVRPEMVFLFLPIMALGVYLRSKANKNSSRFYPVLIVYVLSITILFIAPSQFVTTITRDSNLMIDSTLSAKSAGFSFPFIDLIMKLSGPLKVLGLSFLLIINPVITVIWSQIPFVGNPNWYGYATATYAITWWFCLPFVIRCIFDVLRRKNTWWIILLGTFMIWFILAALARGGGGNDAFRYRDALMPLSLLFLAKGIDCIRKEWKYGGIWPIFFKVYTFIVLGIIMFRGAEILRMS